MSDFSITPVDPISVNTIRKVITSTEISEADKAQFLRDNRQEIAQMIEISITSADFYSMMQSRPLIKFRPLKNSFTKTGDKLLLARSLNIPPDEVSKYIKTVEGQLKELKSDGIPRDEFNKIKTYVYRHGRKDTVITFLNRELETSNDLKKTISNHLEYGFGGIADYFERPIHHLDEKTFVKLIGTFEANIKKAGEAGKIDEKTEEIALKFILGKLYEIRDNQKVFK